MLQGGEACEVPDIPTPRTQAFGTRCVSKELTASSDLAFPVRDLGVQPHRAQGWGVQETDSEASICRSISARWPPQIPHLSRKGVKNLPPGLLAEKAFYSVKSMQRVGRDCRG